MPYCPALPLDGLVVCGTHRDAALVEELGVKDRRCTSCRRKLRRGDWVMRFHDRDTFGYRHVACEPKIAHPTKKQIRESAKPLLEDQ